jgi:hypothetical protein
MQKLTILQINIIGIVIALVIVLILWVGLVRPKQEATQSTRTQIASVESSGGTEQQVMQHQQDAKKAQAEAKRVDQQWHINSARYMPPLPYRTGESPDKLISIYENVPVGSDYRGFKDLPTVWGKWITAWYDTQRKDGVSRTPGTEFPIPAFSTDPNAISGIQNLTFPAPGKPWPVALECKSFGAAMRHLSRFNDMERHGMPVINNVALAGQSPNLMLTYDLQLYIIPGSTPPPADPRLGGTTGNNVGGGAGGIGGYRGGMPGMPPGMMGGMPGMPPGAGTSMGMSGGKRAAMGAGSAD